MILVGVSVRGCNKPYLDSEEKIIGQYCWTEFFSSPLNSFLIFNNDGNNHIYIASVCRAIYRSAALSSKPMRTRAGLRHVWGFRPNSAVDF